MKAAPPRASAPHRVWGPGSALTPLVALVLVCSSWATQAAPGAAGPMAARAGRVAVLAEAGGAAVAAAAPDWRAQFDDPVLTSLLAPLAAQDEARAQTLARQWVAVRVYHAQWSVVEVLLRLGKAEQAALMDLPPDTSGRDQALSRVAAQLDQAARFGTDRATRRDRAIVAVAELAGMPTAQLLAQVGAPLTQWRLPHLVAEPPTVRVTLSANTTELAQRVTALHASHDAALKADRAALAARQTVAQAMAASREAAANPASGTATRPEDLGTQADALDPATSHAYQAWMLALNAQAIAAGDLALAWLDYLALETVTPSAASHSATRAGGNGLGRPV